MLPHVTTKNIFPVTCSPLQELEGTTIESPTLDETNAPIEAAEEEDMVNLKVEENKPEEEEEIYDPPTTTEIEKLLSSVETKETGKSSEVSTLGDLDVEEQQDSEKPSIREMMEENEAVQHGGNDGGIHGGSHGSNHGSSENSDDSSDEEEHEENSSKRMTLTVLCLIFPIAQVMFFFV